MKTAILIAILTLCTALGGCYRMVEGHAYWQEDGQVMGADGNTYPVRVECRAGKTVIFSEKYALRIDREVEAVTIKKQFISTIERAKDGGMLYQVMYALDENMAVIAISRDVVRPVRVSSL